MAPHASTSTCTGRLTHGYTPPDASMPWGSHAGRLTPAHSWRFHTAAQTARHIWALGPLVPYAPMLPLHALAWALPATARATEKKRTVSSTSVACAAGPATLAHVQPAVGCVPASVRGEPTPHATAPRHEILSRRQKTALVGRVDQWCTCLSSVSQHQWQVLCRTVPLCRHAPPLPHPTYTPCMPCCRPACNTPTRRHALLISFQTNFARVST